MLTSGKQLPVEIGPRRAGRRTLQVFPDTASITTANVGSAHILQNGTDYVLHMNIDSREGDAFERSDSIERLANEITSGTRANFRVSGGNDYIGVARYDAVAATGVYYNVFVQLRDAPTDLPTQTDTAFGFFSRTDTYRVGGPIIDRATAKWWFLTYLSFSSPTIHMRGPATKTKAGVLEVQEIELRSGADSTQETVTVNGSDSLLEIGPEPSLLVVRGVMNRTPEFDLTHTDGTWTVDGENYALSVYVENETGFKADVEIVRSIPLI